jgi:hypothetical protein
MLESMLVILLISIIAIATLFRGLLKAEGKNAELEEKNEALKKKEIRTSGLLDSKNRQIDTLEREVWELKRKIVRIKSGKDEEIMDEDSTLKSIDHALFRAQSFKDMAERVETGGFMVDMTRPQPSRGNIMNRIEGARRTKVPPVNNDITNPLNPVGLLYNYGNDNDSCNKHDSHSHSPSVDHTPSYNTDTNFNSDSSSSFDSGGGGGFDSGSF